VYEVLFPVFRTVLIRKQSDPDCLDQGFGSVLDPDSIRSVDPDSIRSVDPDPYYESGSGSRRAKMTHKSKAGRTAPLGTACHVHISRQPIVCEVLFPVFRIWICFVLRTVFWIRIQSYPDCLDQGFGSGSGLDPDSIRSVDPDLDSK
jgi:hypothetical protein